jgi:hypothetical protein
MEISENLKQAGKIIANLNDLLQRIEQPKKGDELDRFQDEINAAGYSVLDLQTRYLKKQLPRHYDEFVDFSADLYDELIDQMHELLHIPGLD